MDEAAYIALCEEHLPSFYRIACSIVGNPQDAEDAVQQALLNAWRARDKARPGAERAWVMRILINECYSLLRRRKRLIPTAALPLPPSPAEADTALQDAIRSLPEILRTPVLLKYMEGMSEKEAAAALGLPVSTVKNRLYRARKQLQTLLNEEVGL